MFYLTTHHVHLLFYKPDYIATATHDVIRHWKTEAHSVKEVKSNSLDKLKPAF